MFSFFFFFVFGAQNTAAAVCCEKPKPCLIAINQMLLIRLGAHVLVCTWSADGKHVHSHIVMHSVVSEN